MKNILILFTLLFVVNANATITNKTITEETKRALIKLHDYDRLYVLCMTNILRDWENVSRPDYRVAITTEFHSYYYTMYIGWLSLQDGSFQKSSWCHAVPTYQTSDKAKPKDQRITKNKKACGSVIDFEKKTVAESIPLAGTSFNLNYSSEFNNLTNLNRKIENTYTVYENENTYQFKILDSNQNQLYSYNYAAMPPYAFSTEFVVPLESTLWSTDPFKSVAKLNILLSGTEMVISNCREESIGINPETGEEQFELKCDQPKKNEFIIESSEKNIVLYNPKVWGLAGWTISGHHYFDVKSLLLFAGNGERLEYTGFQSVDDVNLGRVNVVVSKYNEEELFVFDRQGRHLETRNAIQGYVIHKFSYNSNNRLVSIEDRFGSKTTFVYDGTSQLEKIVSPDGVETNFQVVQGRIVKATDSQNLSYEMAYDATELLKTFKSVNDVATTFTYNTDGEFLREEKNTGVLQYFTQTINQNITELTKYFSFGLVKRIQTVLTDMGIEDREVDENNSLVSKEFKPYKENFSSTEFEGDVRTQFFNLTEEWQNDRIFVNSIRHEVSENEQYVIEDIRRSEARTYGDSILDLQTYESKTNARNAEIISRFDKASNAMASVDQFGVTTTTELNNLGLVTKISRKDKYPTLFEYDPRGRLTKVVKGQQFESYAYDVNGYLAATNNSKNQLTQFLRNKKGQLVKQILPNQDSIQFEYTNGGELKKVIAPNNQVHNFQFDLGDYVSQAITPNNKITSYTYDSDKRLSQVTKPSGKKLKYEYAQGKKDLQRIVTAEGNVTINSRDIRSRITSTTSADNIKTDIAWASDQVQSQTWYDNGQLIAKLSNTYAPDQFQIESIHLNDELVAKYSYGAGGVLRSIDNIGMNYAHEFGDLYSNLRVSAAVGNFSVDYTQQDNLNGEQPTQLVSAKVYDGPQSQLYISLKRAYDNFGQATEFMTTTMNHATGVYNSYYSLVPEYDSNSRLVKVSKTRKSFANGREVDSVDFMNSYLYPANSNNNVKTFEQKISVDQNPVKRTITSHNNDDQLMKLQGSINRDYKYSEDGDLSEMTNCFGSVTYEYDSFGNLKKINFPSGKIVEYKIDAQNRRFKKLVNGQVREYYIWYDQTRLAAILDANKQPKLVYIYGSESENVPSYLVKDGKTYKIIHDPGMQSVRYVVDMQDAMIVQEAEYDEHGNFMKNTNPNFQPLTFAGGLYDQDTKFVRFGARDYDPTIGRWTTKDPIGFAGGDTNLYAYVQGNPMSRIDPDGESPILLVPALILTTALIASEVQDYQNDPFYLIKRQVLLDNFLNQFKNKEEGEQCPKYRPAAPENLPNKKSPGDMRKRRSKA